MKKIFGMKGAKRKVWPKRTKKEKLRRRSQFALDSSKKRINREYRLGSPTEHVRIELASNFNFSSNYDETVESLQTFKKKVFTHSDPKVKRDVYVDLSTVRNISVAGALVLAAEIHRWKIIKQIRLVTRGDENWDQNVKGLFYSFGLFELLNVKPVIAENYENRDEVAALPLYSSTKLETGLLNIKIWKANELELIQNHLRILYPAIIEASINAVYHAYPKEGKFLFQHTKRFWVTACIVKSGTMVRFLVYDQGVGIPKTLKTRYVPEKIRNQIKNIIGLRKLSNNDSSLIEAALELSRTRMEQGRRGKGLMQVINPAIKIPDAKVRIFSGFGQIEVFSKDRIDKRENSYHIGGTLIEWTIPVN